MNEHTDFTQNIDTLFSDLQNFAKTESVLGNPLIVGDKTLVPVMSVTLGYGSAGMGTKIDQPETKNASNGIGLGAKISTSAVVIVEKTGVSMLPVSEKSNMGQLMDKIPQAIASMTQGSTQQGASQGQGQQQNPLQNIVQGMTGGQQAQQQAASQNQQQNPAATPQKKQ
jgi:uncharacterized spore protein YtfJ